jgi:Fur family transcriptional regulator, ferric uptake regulator
MLDKFKQHLKTAGQSVTGPRLAVFEFLQEYDTATVADVIARNAHIDQASVYRTLALFRELGVIQDIVTGGRRMIELTDGFDSHHHHLSCIKCGAIKTIDDPAIEQRLDQIARLHGFEPASHQIEVSGICANCRALSRLA